MIAVVVDTSAYSAWRRGDSRAISVVESAQVFVMSPVVIGELLAGFSGGVRAQENRRLLRDFLDQPSVQVVHIDEQTAGYYAHIIASLRISGRPIPSNDGWIAAIARQMSLPVWSYDKHFQAVEGVVNVTAAIDLK